MSAAIITIAVLAISCAMAFGSERPIIPAEKGKKACTYVIGFKSGNLAVYYEKILVVAEKPALDENGNPKPEWWVVSRQNPNERDKEGREIAFNVSKDKVLFTNPTDGPVVVIHKMMTCKCPSFFWGGGNSGISAEH